MESSMRLSVVLHMRCGQNLQFLRKGTIKIAWFVQIRDMHHHSETAYMNAIFEGLICVCVDKPV